MDKLTRQLSRLTLSKNLGQYFTTHVSLKQKVVEFIHNNPERILEPSCGRGDLIQYAQQHLDASFDAYEIDERITPLPGISGVVHCDFLSATIDRTYKTIIGNPPYIRQRKAKNTYLRFIERCMELLDTDGELIFIVPSAFLKLTSASSTIRMMLEKGSFTHFFHPSDEHLFSGAAIDVIVFRYQLGFFDNNKVRFNDTNMVYEVNDGIITFRDANYDIGTTRLVSDCFDVYVGLVSGIDRVLKNQELGNTDIQTDLDRTDRFIFLESYPTGVTALDKYLEDNKLDLISRRIKRFNDKNWYQFGAIRNISIMRNCKDRPCIYVRTMSRKDTIASVGRVSYFGGSLLMLLPKDDAAIGLDDICSRINSRCFRNNYTYDKRFVISQKQLLNASI